MAIETIKTFKKQVREAISNYMRSEGCGCCSDAKDHEANAERLAKLLSVPKYKDGSGYNFPKFITKEHKPTKRNLIGLS